MKKTIATLTILCLLCLTVFAVDTSPFKSPMASILFSKGALHNERDGIRVVSDVSYATPNSKIVTDSVTPSVEIGTKLNVQMRFTQEIKKDSVVNFFNWISDSYHDYSMVVMVSIPDLEENEVSLLANKGLKEYSLGSWGYYESEKNKYWCKCFYWDCGSKEKVEVSFQINPTFPNDYKIFIDFYIIKNLESYISLEDYLVHLSTDQKNVKIFSYEESCKYITVQYK